jgi:hypothetical protein
MADSLVVIPDIHGRLDRLQNLSGTLCLLGYDERPWVFLGDYIDRGPDSLGVLDYLMALRKEHVYWIFLRGNHEQMMLDYLALGSLQWFHEANGGRQTVDSYERFYSREFKKRENFCSIPSSITKQKTISLVMLRFQRSSIALQNWCLPQDMYFRPSFAIGPILVPPMKLNMLWRIPIALQSVDMSTSSIKEKRQHASMTTSAI